ncbi:MAG: phosphodiesterase [Rhizobiales bacterium]|nr:phosphodiesterase [Hyphomicrobiales bacterium]MBI3674242.1 phosphodiesterase [Hyphomicrobiales bacterium]
MKFIHLTDLHLGKPGELLWGLDPFARLDACLTDIAAHHSDASFCAITGDLAEQGEIASYRVLKRRLEELPIETYLMLGNHDSRANYLQVFGGADPAGHVQQAIARNGSYFLFLDTLKGPPSSAGLYDAPRRAWLKAELDRAGDAPVYLFMHHPPFDIGHPLQDLIKLDDPEGFADLLNDHDIHHIFFGHAHRPISGQWRGIPFSALPSLNHQLPLVGGSVETVYSDEPPMYAVVLIEHDRTIVHADAFLNRGPARMAKDAERDNWY